MSQPEPTADPVTVPGSGSCVRLVRGALLRKAKLSGDATLTLQLDGGTGAVRVRAPRGRVRSVTLTLDGKRLSRARGGSLTALIPMAGLARGKHVLRATVQPRHGKSLTLTVHLTSASC